MLEIMTDPCPDNTDPSWFPRRLRVRIDATAVVSDDRFLTRDVLVALHCLMEEDWYRRGSYRNGTEYVVGVVTLRLTYTNRNGPTWYWRLYNRVWRGPLSWRSRFNALIGTIWCRVTGRWW